MSKKSNILNEQMDSELTYSSGNNKPEGVLGRLSGPCADFKNLTRNGRLYGLQLWESVLKDPEVEEGLKTKTLFGEADHPESRLETSLKEVAISIVDLSLDYDEGVLNGVFDILDTPNGRILHSLAKYGARIGVSSRGSGEIIETANGPEVDPSTYKFITFDAVTMPAVVKARPQVEMLESAKVSAPQKLVESLKSDIHNARTESELNLLKSIISKTQLSSKDSLLETIENKLSVCDEAGRSTSALVDEIRHLSESVSQLQLQNSKLENQLQVSRSKCTSQSSKLEKCLDASSRLTKSVNHLKDQNQKLKTDVQCKSQLLESMKNMLVKKDALIQYYSTKFQDAETQITKFDQLQERYNSLKLRSSKMIKNYNSSAQATKTELKESVSKLNSSMKTISQLENSIREKDLELHELRESTSQYKSQSRSARTLNSAYRNAYVRLKCKMNNLNESKLLNQISDTMDITAVNHLIDKEIQLNDNRATALPYHQSQFTESLSSAQVELPDSSIDNEDSQSMAFAQALNKYK